MDSTSSSAAAGHKPYVHLLDTFHPANHSVMLIFHFDGVHSGDGVTAVIWYIDVLVLLLALFLVIIAVAHPHPACAITTCSN
ncbi:hypothetical protein VTJ04DRAFT_1942 [Mycothermus thermophilus]|uniref:uncharacterized protein n=1 Tax=Humicola insolens TaxID=85995 RepID=UPI00374285C2